MRLSSLSPLRRLFWGKDERYFRWEYSSSYSPFIGSFLIEVENEISVGSFGCLFVGVDEKFGVIGERLPSKMLNLSFVVRIFYYLILFGVEADVPHAFSLMI